MALSGSALNQRRKELSSPGCPSRCMATACCPRSPVCVTTVLTLLQLLDLCRKSRCFLLVLQAQMWKKESAKEGAPNQVKGKSLALTSWVLGMWGAWPGRVSAGVSVAAQHWRPLRAELLGTASNVWGATPQRHSGPGQDTWQVAVAKERGPSLWWPCSPGWWAAVP